MSDSVEESAHAKCVDSTSTVTHCGFDEDTQPSTALPAVNTMDLDQARSVDLADLLSRLGFAPSYQRGRELWYLSPFRDEQNPSFRINDKNRWYDFGTGDHGDAIDFVKQHCRCGNLKETLQEMASIMGRTAPTPLDRTAIPSREHLATEITSVGPLRSRSLLKFLQSRGISEDIASPSLKEVRYKRGDRDYFGIGFENNAGGYELRTPRFKGTLQNKAVSSRGELGQPLHVFEGFIDYLSAIQLGHIQGTNSAVILNSTALVAAGVEAATALRPTHISLWLDNDTAGRKATEEFRLAFAEIMPDVQIEDQSSAYQDHNDLNEWHMQQCKSRRR
ncbi:MAG: toprim domain-containing protein [Planctomycetota bacterium]